MIHAWQAVDGGFVCSQCGAKSARGTSQGQCQTREKRPAVERVELPQRKPRAACRHKGDQATKDGEPWLHHCGCPASEKIPVYGCAIHGFCLRYADRPPEGVAQCHRCKDYEPITEDG